VCAKPIQQADESSGFQQRGNRVGTFDPRLRTHKIHKLSALYGCTIYAVDLEGDLRSTFYIEGDWIVSVDIGTHDLYKG
jgi:hypothetical protein